MVSVLSAWYGLMGTLGFFNPYVPIVETEYGPVQGVGGKSRGGLTYFRYLGIPYAVADRYEPPRPPKPWTTLFNADRFGSICKQMDAFVTGKILGDEDCLTLNVFTPEVKRNGSLLPVIVYIHGGGFTAGSTRDYEPKYFMDHELVVVSMNYRLGALGFLSTGDDLIKGNMGFKDQAMALRWVRDNINKFGGDPSKVTLMGESAGAASVHYHMVSPRSQGLFHKAILQSGNLLCPWAFVENPKEQAYRYGKILGCSTNSSEELVKCLKNMESDDLVKPHVALMSPLFKSNDLFAGTIEAITTNDTFLSKNPYELLKSGNFSKVPAIFGVTSGEGGLKISRIEAYPEVLPTIESNWSAFLPTMLQYDGNWKNVSEKLTNHFIPRQSRGDRNSRAIDEENETIVLKKISDMFASRMFYQPLHDAAEHHAQYAPTFLYYYSYISKGYPSLVYTILKGVEPSISSWVPGMIRLAGLLARDYTAKLLFPSIKQRQESLGACHGDDNLLLWSFNWVTDISPSSRDYVTSDNYVRLITNFVKSRELEKMSAFELDWPSANSTPNKYLQIDSTPNVIPEPFENDVKFLDSIGIETGLKK